MIINGSWILLAAGAWAIYRLACWLDARTPNRENGSRDA